MQAYANKNPEKIKFMTFSRRFPHYEVWYVKKKCIILKFQATHQIIALKTLFRKKKTRSLSSSAYLMLFFLLKEKWWFIASASALFHIERLLNVGTHAILFDRKCLWETNRFVFYYKMLSKMSVVIINLLTLCLYPLFAVSKTLKRNLYNLM